MCSADIAAASGVGQQRLLGVHYDAYGGELELQLLAKGTTVPSQERQRISILAYIQVMQPANWTEADLLASRTLRHPQAQKGTATFGSVSIDRAISRVSFYVLLNFRATAAAVPVLRVARVQFYVRVRKCLGVAQQPDGEVADGQLRLAICTLFVHNMEESSMLCKTRHSITLAWQLMRLASLACLCRASARVQRKGSGIS